MDSKQKKSSPTSNFRFKQNKFWDISLKSFIIFLDYVNFKDIDFKKFIENAIDQSFFNFVGLKQRVLRWIY